MTNKTTDLEHELITHLEHQRCELHHLRAQFRIATEALEDIAKVSHSPASLGWAKLHAACVLSDLQQRDLPMQPVTFVAREVG